MTVFINPWTDDRVALLRKLWDDQLSCSEIAEQLGGVTRNAVIGKASRLGLPERMGSMWRAPRDRNAPRKPATGKTSQQASHAPRQSILTGGFYGQTALAIPPEAVEPAPEPVQDVKPVVVPICKPLSIMQLKTYHCRWITTDGNHETRRFCGKHATPGASWCAVHSKRVFAPMETRRRSAPCS